MQLIPYGRQHITEADIAAVTEALTSDFLTQGPRVKAFEDKFAEYIGVKYAVAVANGTAALHLGAMALGVDEQSKVITTPITFSASANCVRYCGGEVAFADIDPETALLDIDKVRALLEQHPKGSFQGIIPVDLAGYPLDLEAFRSLADEYGMWIMEDACHAPGGYFVDSQGQQQYCGNGQYAELAVFSFHPVKHIAAGEGGMITTNDEALYQKLLMLRTHGITKDPHLMAENHGGWYYEMQELGYNYRMPDILAALGTSQLAGADEGLKRRQAIAKLYHEAFADLPIKHLAPSAKVKHAYHLYVILTNDRKGLYDALRARSIYVQIHYIPVPQLPYYQALGYRMADYPAAQQYYDSCLSLPMYPSLTEEEQLYVIEQVKAYLSVAE